MRSALLAICLLLGSRDTIAADPPIVFQMHPPGRVLDDLRAAARVAGDEKGVKSLNALIEKALGEKGFDGLDLNRPIVGYVILAPKPEDVTAVFAVPITGEKEFLDLCERANKRKPALAGKEKDVYELPPLDPRFKALMRFSDQHAYLAYGANPRPALDPKALVPAASLYVPNERGLIAARLYFDRIPLAVKLALPALMENVKRTVLGGLQAGKGDDPIVKAVLPEIEKLVTRYVLLAAGADVLAARVILDVPAGNLVLEATLNGKPGSELSGIIAAWMPTQNKFGGLLTAPDTVAGFKMRLPLFEKEIRDAAVAGIEAGQKDAVNNAKKTAQPVLEELFKCLARTVKTGEFDLIGAVRGPDKNGWFTFVGAVAFEDPAALEKEFKAFVASDAPPDVKEAIKWDVAKVGTVNVHTWKLNKGGLFFIDFTKVFGGEDCTVAFAFAPHGTHVVMGPDAVNTIKDALAVKPADSPILDVVANSARMIKLFEKTSGPNDPNVATAAQVLGKEDKLVSLTSVTLEGGKQLTARVTINLRGIPRWLLHSESAQADKAPPEELGKKE